MPTTWVLACCGSPKGEAQAGGLIASGGRLATEAGVSDAFACGTTEDSLANTVQATWLL